MIRIRRNGSMVSFHGPMKALEFIEAFDVGPPPVGDCDKAIAEADGPRCTVFVELHHYDRSNELLALGELQVVANERRLHIVLESRQQRDGTYPDKGYVMFAALERLQNTIDAISYTFDNS